MDKTKIVRIGGFSGGIDSQAMALWMRRTFPPEEVLLMNSTAGGNEHQITTQFVKDYSANVYPVVMVDALVRDLNNIGTRDGETGRRRATLDPDGPLTFDTLAYVKQRFPSRKAQFCTQYLKLTPHVRWIRENLIDKYPGVTIERYVGIRADESEQRKDKPAQEWDEMLLCELFRPILTWTKQQCFDYVREAGEQVNPLYTMGFNRVGCAPCVNSGKDDIREWAARFPEMIDKVRGWEESVKRTFFPPCVPGLEINWIDEVVAWSKTGHGGRQPLFAFAENDAADGVCISKYGLCE